MQYPMLAYISHFKRYYVQLFQPLAAEYGLSHLEVEILLFLRNNPEYDTARDIVEVRGFAKSNVSNAVESLRQKGYLCSAAAPENRKVQRLSLLSQKTEQLRELALCQERGFASVLADFTPEEYALLAELFQRADHNIMCALESRGRK